MTRTFISACCWTAITSTGARALTADYTHGLYRGNMILVAMVTRHQFKRFEQQLKVSKERYTLNLSTVRSMHGKTNANKLYKNSRNGKMAKGPSG